MIVPYLAACTVLQADKNGDEILGSLLHARVRTRESYWALVRFQGRIRSK